MYRQEYRISRFAYSCLYIFLPTFLLVASFTSDAQAQDGPTSLQLKRLARQSFAQGDSEAGHKHLTTLLERYRQQSALEPNRWCGRLAEVAREYLRAGDLKQASLLLGEAADLNLPFDDTKEDGLASAAAGWHRRLATLDAEERFELLRDWTMPTESRKSVRVLTTIVPADAPPEVFARALGERPRRDSFTVAEVGGVSGLFCSAWELTRAADEVGRLRRLTAEISALADADVPHAPIVLTLIRIFVAESPNAEQSPRQLLTFSVSSIR